MQYLMVTLYASIDDDKITMITSNGSCVYMSTCIYHYVIAIAACCDEWMNKMNEKYRGFVECIDKLQNVCDIARKRGVLLYIYVYNTLAP